MALETDAATNVLPVDSLLEAVRYVATLAHQEARPAKPHTSALAQGRKTKDQSQAMQIIACFRTCPGVGEKKAGELAAVFKSVESLANASEDAVAAVVGKATAKRIVLFFNDPIWDNGSGRTLSAANKVGIQV
ncbi:hypothetical protein DFJ77DRAFT_260952 [Powellomyces hirtus]|nr:hypothetical protein DFJ77DRAFT_260952 [Powellomyces hirtus]